MNKRQMKQSQINKSKMGFGLIEIVLVLAAILFLYYFMSKFHLERPHIDKETQKAASEQGIDTTSYKSTLDTVKKKLRDSQDQDAKRTSEMEDLK